MPGTTASPAKGERTRQRILDTAADLFHRQGVNATSLGEVLRASGAGKGQFYQHFASREELVEEVLEGHRAFLAGVAPIRSWDDLHAWMHHYLEMQRSFGFERGCPVGTAAYALRPDQRQPRSTLKAIFDRMRDDLATFLDQERQAGRVTDDADPRRLAHFTVAAVQGGMLLGLLDRGPDPARAAIEEAFAHLTWYRTGRS